MPNFDTEMGGKEGRFPETVWSAILTSADPDTLVRKGALDRFAALYWRPVYRFIRSWGRPVEDAKDLTQAFFCHILEREVVARYQREKGRFRSFLKGALRNFLAEAQRDARCLKRGGGHLFVPLDVADLETDDAVAEARRNGPEALFDRQWAADVIAAALARLQDELTREGKTLYLRAYEKYELLPEGSPTYESVAAELGLVPHDVKNYLQHVRSRLRALVLEALAPTCSSREELLDELGGILSG